MANVSGSPRLTGGAEATSWPSAYGVLQTETFVVKYSDPPPTATPWTSVSGGWARGTSRPRPQTGRAVVPPSVCSCASGRDGECDEPEQAATNETMESRASRIPSDDRGRFIAVSLSES